MASSTARAHRELSLAFCNCCMYQLCNGHVLRASVFADDLQGRDEVWLSLGACATLVDRSDRRFFCGIMALKTQSARLSRWGARGAGILWAAALAACNVGPNYHTPDTNIEKSYAPTEAQSAPTSWWTALDDPALDSLVSEAAANNLNLHQAEARIRESRAQQAVVQGQDLPNLNGDVDYTHQRYSQNAAPFNAFNVPGFPWEFNLYQAGFDASWEVDIFGGNRRALEAAKDSVQAAQEDQHSVLVSLLGEVGRNYVALRGYQQEQVFAQHNLDVQNQTLALTRDRERNGVGNHLDVARAEAQVADTAAAIPVFERQEWQAIHRLCVLTNQPLDKVLYLRQIGAIPATPDAVSAGIPAELLRRRPDIRSAERHLAAATARIGQAEAELYPKL